MNLYLLKHDETPVVSLKKFKFKIWEDLVKEMEIFVCELNLLCSFGGGGRRRRM